MSDADPPGLPGLYVHFAYCARRCVYCDFALATPRTIPAEAYTNALIAELEARLERHGVPRAARTLYVGGGTPSLWPQAELGRFMEAVARAMPLVPGAEVTLEANPEEVDDAMVDGLVSLGINRVSLGVQTLDEAQLLRLSRAHDAARAESALATLAAAHRAGRLRSYSVDLMYGLPGETLAGWLTRLEDLVTRYRPPHLSCYALTVEARTVLGLDVRKGRVAPPDDGLQAEMLFSARDLLKGLGYTHYEVSSWAQPGHLAVHNSAYWEMRPYLALGAGAHGFLGGLRYRNEGRPSRYIERVTDGHPDVESELITPETARFERLMTGLRRLDIGVALGPEDAHDWTRIDEEVARGRLIREGDRIRLTDLGVRYMDDVLLAFVP